MRRSKWVIEISCLVVATIAFAPLHAELIDRRVNVDGTSVDFKVVLPNDFDAEMTYPGVLVFGGGPQTMRTVEGTLSRNFRDEAETRGFIVIAPAAPNGELFFQRGARIFPQFLDRILADYRIAKNRFHIAGPSNGGIAAFHVAAQNPEYFLSVTAFPGYLWQPSQAKLRAIADLCVFAYVGEFDEYMWHEEMKREVAFLAELGTLARYSLEQGQPHRLESLAGANAGRLFDGFEEAERGCSR